MNAQELINGRIIERAKELAERRGGDYTDYLDEAKYDFRNSYDYEGIGIEAWEWSRNYECEPVVKKIGDQYVCWLYWSGGGKHGNPDSIEWIDNAIIVTEGEPVVRKTFIKQPKEGAN